jgi:ATP-dependent protease Clp ATPase subunit
MIPGYLERVFEKNVTVIQEYKNSDLQSIFVTLVFNVIDVGKLQVSEGKIIACDPFQAHKVDHEKPILADFPKGEFICQLAIANIDNNIDKRIGFSRIKFSDNLPIRCKPLMTYILF